MPEFNTWEQLPRLTETGFKIIKCPEAQWQQIRDLYRRVQAAPTAEYFEGIETTIPNPNQAPTKLFSLEQYRADRDRIHRELLELHETWSQQKLIPTAVYGIRSYNNQSSLTMHRDREATHHVSSIVIVDTHEHEPWPLHIEDHQGNLHRLYTEPGQIILYESARLLHGRPDQFRGNYYRNFYIHYRLRDWEWTGAQQ